MGMGWSDGHSGLQCLLSMYIVESHSIPSCGRRRKDKIVLSMSSCSVGEEGSQILCVPTLQLPGRDTLRGCWVVCRKTHPIGSIDGPSIRLGNIKKDSGCADNAGPVTCICHDERV
jgi:hypothetical protein